MNGKQIALVACVAAIVMSLANVDLAVSEVIVYEDVPDVDKSLSLDPAGNSSWQAAAANLLAGAGYGIGADAQTRANNIYQTLVADLGTAYLGNTAKAIDHWLSNYGKNPDKPEFQPNNPYTDVTTIGATLGLADYEFLLDELVRLQYVAVSFAGPTPHTMTLVGGDRTSGAYSYWHDSHKDVGNVPAPGTSNDDLYNNDFTSGWDLRAPGDNSLYLQNADGYVTLRPGLNKPEAPAMNYDVAYFMRGDTLETPGFRTAGAMDGSGSGDYEQPYWLRGEDQTFHVDNEFIPGQYKEIWLLVDYTDHVEDRDQIEGDIVLRSPNGTTYLPTSIEAGDDDGQLMFYWKLPDQPEWGEFIFPDAKYRNLAGNVGNWSMTTICTTISIPEPTTITLLGLGGLAVLKRRRNK